MKVMCVEEQYLNLFVYTIFTHVLHTIFLKLALKNMECLSFKSIFSSEQAARLSDIYIIDSL